eukprot:CAMPEP_0169172752 /NCGR_PEP_ID=MMETSP1015-20121227/63552_1 /TAXON_ID=342587 /ORGANISM="Karlodinium micrum, Strain CCMP2283" /LENGTH=39 /DNA_ID= /DNA_START= /DNA_END= /DNA_ORIENTATION=
MPKTIAEEQSSEAAHEGYGSRVSPMNRSDSSMRSARESD